MSIAEDTQDAGKVLPRSLMWSTVMNEVLCVVLSILIAMSIGNADALFAGKYGSTAHPSASIVQLTDNVTRGNKAMATAVFVLMAPIIFMCCVNTTAAASRIVFSFIRDDRNPRMHRLMARDLQKKTVPRITIIFTALSPVLWLWLNFLSSTGFLAIVSQVIVTLLLSYMFAVACSLYSRIANPDALGTQWEGIFYPGQFWGSVIDTTALCFLSLMFMLAWFPFTTPIDAATTNYGPFIAVGAAFIGIAYYLGYSKKNYINPAPGDEGLNAL